MKEYDVHFDMKWSHIFTIQAKNKADAKGKAFERMKTKAKNRSEYTVFCDEV